MADVTDFMLFLEGNIGAGKSSFLKLLGEDLDCRIVFEPHQRWQSLQGDQNLLELFYKSPERWAYTFETYTLLTRLIDQEPFRSLEDHRMVINERSPYSGWYCFAQNTHAQGCMNSLEWGLYQSLCKHLLHQYAIAPTGFIYLKTDPEICLQRLQKRDRHEESNMPLSYLEQIHDQHESWLSQESTIPVLTLDGNLPYLDDLAARDHLVQLVSRFFGVGKKS
ncbi:MAG: deoxynucleoside kinase [Myxococcaceae bacterium]|nr:deoxynucleoside kinase [Myxococcaceae bacterium]MBH2006065.1 deoxynucleoside kinase [Myxococcaceae bacterium]